MKEKIEKRRRNDIILIVGLIVAGIIGFIIINIGRREGEVVIAVQDGKEIGRYSLLDDREIMIESSSGGHNTLVIKDGEASVIEADCPDGLCMRRGKIRYNGESIVCLPNKLVIKIESEKEGEVDVIA